MKPANTTPLDKEIPQRPPLGDIEACTGYAREAVKQSSRPYHTLAYIWTRFLKRSFLEGVQ